MSCEHRRPLYRHEGFEIRREESWSSFASSALASEISENSELLDTFPFDYERINSERELSASPRQDLDEEWARSNALDSGRLLSTCTLESTTSLPDEILSIAQTKHEIFNDPFVVEAFWEAEKAHIGQYRASGEPYLVHCMETALILAGAGASKHVVAAGLLHDTLDDSSWDESQLKHVFGDDVASLVEGVSRLSELSQLARDNNTATNSLEADRLRTMLLAMVDVRVVFIKLADRLHNMRTLGALPAAKQRGIASETLEIFAPLASRLGIWSWKAEMEDLCFMYLNSGEHQKLVDELSKNSREIYVMSALQKLDMALRKVEVPFHDLCGRTKNLYSIYSKMSRKGRSLKEICDVRGLRLIVRDVSSCFTALDLIHELWACIPGKQKDYINHPKHNGYQSLHTAVMGEDGFPLEVQIRTVEMHHNAEFGMAAHWRYKEGDSKYSSYVSQRVEWARWVLTWHSEVMDSKLRVSPLELDLRPPCPFPLHVEDCAHSSGLPENEEDLLYVILLEDEKMIVQELPFISTARDLLTRVRPKDLANDNGLNCWKETRVLINHKAVDDLDQKLIMGDMVELMPFVKEESLDKCREKIRRMYGDTASIRDAMQKSFEVSQTVTVVSN